MNMNTDTPKIYVADLAAYNAGRHNGCWLDLSEHDLDSAQEAVAGLLARSPVEFAEEIAIHDHEGFGGWLGEYSGLDSAVRLAEMIQEHGLEKVSAALNYGGGVYYLDEAEAYLDRYAGTYPSKRHWAEEVLEMEFSTLPKEAQRKLALYFDYEEYADDRETNGDVDFVEDGNEVHVFLHRAE